MNVHQTNGRIGALESWARTIDRTARTKPAHSKSPASLDYWRATVDPKGEMSIPDREKAADNAHRAHMLRLAKASADARRIRKALKKPRPAA
ncbi:hypothetical protein [Streptosporangium jomthongense]|uniref:Uncharacterized protein n=1 Tax=Streptosporangium jomthongense TaxID=1193683 RepID=A0ABV8F9Y4_9ACTN